MTKFYRNILERLFWSYRGFAWRIALYVPSTNGSETINNASYVKAALTKFSSLFGGASATPLKGAWLGENGLVLENTVIVYAFTPKINTQTRRAVIQYAEQLKHDLNQESVAIEIVKTRGGLFLL